MLLPHDWRDRRGVVRAWVTVTGRDGSRRELWSQVPCTRTAAGLAGCSWTASYRRPAAVWTGVDCDQSGPPYPLQRAVWVAPVITDPGAPALPPAPSLPRARSAATATRRPADLGAGPGSRPTCRDAR